MRGKEQIPVFVCTKQGKVACICKQGKKLCDSPDCTREIVELDAYRDVEKLFRQDRYGKCYEISRDKRRK